MRRPEEATQWAGGNGLAGARQLMLALLPSDQVLNARISTGARMAHAERPTDGASDPGSGLTLVVLTEHLSGGGEVLASVQINTNHTNMDFELRNRPYLSLDLASGSAASPPLKPLTSSAVTAPGPP